MRAFALLALLLILLPCTSHGATHSPERTDRVLFVGNSLTYYGNVPAVFSALASANGRPTVSDMIAKGGATLAERVSDGSVARALEGRRYSALVLRERGGDLMCAFGPDSCTRSRQAIQSLAQLAREKGVHVVLLGTYQANPAASRSLVESESAAAAEAGIPYIEVSGKLQRLRATAPELSWFGPDGMHPGKDLVLLDAVLVYQALHDSPPEPGPLTVKAPIYGNNSGLTEALRQADAPPPLPSTPGEVEYPADTLQKLLDAMRGGDS